MNVNGARGWRHCMPSLDRVDLRPSQSGLSTPHSALSTECLHEMLLLPGPLLTDSMTSPSPVPTINQPTNQPTNQPANQPTPRSAVQCSASIGILCACGTETSDAWRRWGQDAHRRSILFNVGWVCGKTATGRGMHPDLMHGGFLASLANHDMALSIADGL